MPQLPYNRTYVLPTTLLQPPMTRLWPDGLPIDVLASRTGRPRRFTWQGQSHQVEEITRHWRVDTGWWAERSWREYHKLVTDTGLLVIVYHDLEGGRWYLQRLYD